MMAGEIEEQTVPLGVDDDERSATAAVELQRRFRGHRTRRNIADMATMAQKFGWWNVVESAMLDNYSSQFYAYNSPQSASQRWLRLKKKAAKVGKGLSKNEKARKLALQHWLEAIDPRHRYGHNLHFYYIEWSNCQTHEPFFYWLDVGEGKDLDLEKCGRSKLQKDLIRYLSPKERKEYEVIIKEGRLFYRLSEMPVDTPKGDKWIFVMSTTGKLYIGKKEKGVLQHSSFLAGGAATAAGRLNVRNGTIEVMEGHSGHYRPTKENFDDLIEILRSSGADLTLAEVRFMSEDMLSSSSKSMKAEGAAEEEIVDISIGIKVQECDESEGNARQLASLALDDEQNLTGVETVTLMESPGVEDEQRDQGRDDHPLHEECAEMKSTLHVQQDDRKGTEGLTVETTKPSEVLAPSVSVNEESDSQSQGDTSGRSFAKPPGIPLSKTVSIGNGHKLYGAAMQTFCKMENRCDTSGDPVLSKYDKATELSANTKTLLMRTFSDSRHPLAASS